MFKIKVKKRDEFLTISNNPVTELQHTKGKSAAYKIAIVPEENINRDVRYSVYATYGKIGTFLKKENIGSFNNFDAAKKLYNKKLKEKLEKGYEIISNKP